MSQNIATSIQTITPQMAKMMMESNTHNRKISRQRLAILVEQIENDEWEFNGEAIKFADDGTLLDGQHRLQAIMVANRAIETLVISGLPNHVQDTMDTGKSRTLADILALRGVQNAVSVASIVTGVLAVEKHGFSNGLIRGSNSAVTNGAALARLESDPRILDIPSLIFTAAKNADLTVKVLGTLYYFFSQIDQEDADYFLARLRDQVGLPEGSPINALVKATKILADAKGARNARYLGALTIKAWNAYREGRDVKVLSFRVGGAKPESYPEPR